MELQYRGSGKAYLNESEYQCDLYYNERQGGIILKIRVKNEKTVGNFLQVPLELSHMCCQLENGFEFTLLRLRRTNMTTLVSYGITIFTFSAEYILCGIVEKKKREQTFHKANFTISNIIEWGAESVFAVGDHFGLIRKNNNIQKTIYMGRDIRIDYIVQGSMLPMVDQNLLKEHIDIEQHGIIEISFDAEERFGKFVEIFKKLKKLIEIASFEKVNVEKVSAYSSDLIYAVGENAIEHPIEVFGKGIQEYIPDVTAQNRSWKWISLSELIAHNSFEYYFDKHSTLAPIIELFLGQFYVEHSSVARTFLNVVQALETYHSRFITNNLDEFKKRVENLAKDCSPVKGGELLAFLMARSKSFITLESRLSDLLYAGGKIYFDTGEIKHKEFPAVIAHTRNYYIHYDEHIKIKHRVLTEEELKFYNRSLLQILEYYILLELGFSDSKEIKSKITERWGKVSQDLEILRISRSQNTPQ